MAGVFVYHTILKPFLDMYMKAPRPGWRAAFLLGVAALAAPVCAQDVVVMRRVLAPPNPKVTPTPTPVAPVELRNGGFENGTSDWTFTGRTSIGSTSAGDNVHGGTKSGYFDGSATTIGAKISQTVTTVRGQTYTLSGYVFQFGIGQLDFYVDGSKIAGTNSGNGGNGAWFLRTGTFIAASSSTRIEVIKANTYNGRTAVDDLVLK